MFEIKGIDPKDGKHKSAGIYDCGTSYLDALNRRGAEGWKSLGVWMNGSRL